MEKENDLTMMWKEVSLGCIAAEPTISLEAQRKKRRHLKKGPFQHEELIISEKLIVNHLFLFIDVTELCRK